MFCWQEIPVILDLEYRVRLALRERLDREDFQALLVPEGRLVDLEDPEDPAGLVGNQCSCFCVF